MGQKQTRTVNDDINFVLSFMEQKDVISLYSDIRECESYWLHVGDDIYEYVKSNENRIMTYLKCNAKKLKDFIDNSFVTGHREELRVIEGLLASPYRLCIVFRVFAYEHMRMSREEYTSDMKRIQREYIG